MKLQALYESVTQSIITELERGAVPWTKVWDSQAGAFLPVNTFTGRHYNGINIPILWDRAIRSGYSSHSWMTFKQALAKGAAVRKGERGTTVVFVKKLPPKEEGEKPITMLKTHSVFNIAQIDGLPEPDPPQERPLHERHASVEDFVQATKAKIQHGHYEPCYIPSEDAVCLPAREHFKADEHYYATLLHECVHWTGPRLERNLHNRFGTKDYAAEELVAELGAAFLCAHLGIQGELRHAGYIQSWLKLLREDDKAIFTAASKASEAANYLRSFSEKL